jgi:hypothetical protein
MVPKSPSQARITTGPVAPGLLCENAATYPKEARRLENTQYNQYHYPQGPLHSLIPGPPFLVPAVPSRKTTSEPVDFPVAQSSSPKAPCTSVWCYIKLDL